MVDLRELEIESRIQMTTKREQVRSHVSDPGDEKPYFCKTQTISKGYPRN
jgi:hypothetical protein